MLAVGAVTVPFLIRGRDGGARAPIRAVAQPDRAAPVAPDAAGVPLPVRLTGAAAKFTGDNADAPAISSAELLTLERELKQTADATWPMYRDMTLACRGAMEDARGMQWGQRACETFFGSPERRATLDLDAVRDFARWADRVHLAAAKSESTELAETLIAFAQDGRLQLRKGDASLFGSLLAGSGARERLRSAVEDGTGLPNPALGEIVTWAHRHADDMPAWKQHVEDRVAATDGDTKALWLAIQGGVEAVRFTPVQPGRRGVWLAEAEKIAQRDTTRKQLAVCRAY